MDDDIQGTYQEYQSALNKNTAFDFDDLILKPIEMFSDNGFLQKYRERFMHIIVDEYQDINPAQYRLLKLLAGDNANICAVGDSDQAIYAFRGADIENFLNFEKDFKDAKTIALSRNYRSN
ncbi:MAG: UvrD-helicase domain-containing protein [Nitrospirae bacterium]|nr:UvrD-helicase domain-containing protein [Nitrospirota bacterium]